MIWLFYNHIIYISRSVNQVKQFLLDNLVPIFRNEYPSRKDELENFLIRLCTNDNLSKRIACNIAIDIASRNISSKAYGEFISLIPLDVNKDYPSLQFDNFSNNNDILKKFEASFSSKSDRRKTKYVRVIDLGTFLNYIYLISERGITFSYSVYNNWKKYEIDTDNEIDISGVTNSEFYMLRGAKPLAWLMPLDEFERVSSEAVALGQNKSNELLKHLAVKAEKGKNEKSFLVALHYEGINVVQYQPVAFHGVYKVYNTYGFVGFRQHDNFGRTAGSLLGRENIQERIHLETKLIDETIKAYSIGELSEDILINDKDLLNEGRERLSKIIEEIK